MAVDAALPSPVPLTILVADDDAGSRRIVAGMLRKAGYEVIQAENGAQAWALLQRADGPQLAILDWMMPELDGTEVCRRVRAVPTDTPAYLILLTSRGRSVDIVEGLKAGANDHVTKPADEGELLARVQVGARVVHLQHALADRVARLEEALRNVQQLQGLLPICSYCKRIRDDRNYWQQVESYITHHADVQFSHSCCPDCYERVVKPELDALEASDGDT
ncbi:MAG: response regulator [Vicinamibacterales bacterium]|nr:response regulator [Vicinamibacterales bacterium]